MEEKTIKNYGNLKDNKDGKITTELISDVLLRRNSYEYKGWILPNGQVVGIHPSTSHSDYVKIFMEGLKDYDIKTYNRVMNLYDLYQEDNIYSDIQESFAVEILGWVQVSPYARKLIICKAEHFQDKLIADLLNNHGYNYVVCNRYQKTYHLDCYDDIDIIMEYGQKKSKKLTLNKNEWIK